MLGERTKADMAQRSWTAGAHGTTHGPAVGRGRASPGTAGRADRGSEARPERVTYPKMARILTDEGVPKANGKEVWGESPVRSALRVNPTPPPAEARQGQPAGTQDGSRMTGTNRLMTSCGRSKYD
jgi:hypothetical protein